ncbi:MAG TPA: mechanosensitive ion channel family protein [Verrucomicrobiae bacterium]|nr:mechanosensitive ion channel family protein [Verrucomicrobiae bacterium]
MTKSDRVLEAVRVWLMHQGLIVLVIVVATLIALKLAAVINRRLFHRLFKDKPGEDSQKLAQTVALTADWVVSIAIVGAAVSFLLIDLGVNMEHVADLALAWLLTNGLGIALIIVLTFGVMKVAGILAERVVMFLRRDKLDLESQKRADTLTSVIRWVLRTSILLISSVMLLGQFGVQIGPILAAAGVVGIAVGFGAQNLVQDVISGFFLLLEDQVRVGDVVQLNDKSGLVEKINLRMTILRDFSGTVHYVRNGKIDVVSNMTKEYSFAVMEIGIAYREDPDEVMGVITAIGNGLREDPAFKNDILSPIEIAGLDKFGDSAIVIKARIKTRPSKQWSTGREFNRRLKKKFDELNIEMPFPHMTIYPGKDKQGDSPSLKLELEGNSQPATAEKDAPSSAPQVGSRHGV